MTAHMLKQMGSLKPLREEDPREAILKYAQAAEGMITISNYYILSLLYFYMQIGTSKLISFLYPSFFSSFVFLENPTYFGVYKANQPKTIFNMEPEEDPTAQK